MHYCLTKIHTIRQYIVTLARYVFLNLYFFKNLLDENIGKTLIYNSVAGANTNKEMGNVSLRLIFCRFANIPIENQSLENFN